MKGIEFLIHPDVKVRGIVVEEAYVIELDAIHHIWGHSGAGAGQRHEVPEESHEVTLKPYEVRRLALIEEARSL